MFAHPIELFAGQVSNPATFCRQVNSRLSDDDTLGLRLAELNDRNGRSHLTFEGVYRRGANSMRVRSRRVRLAST
jgi:hypothetical protein